MTALQKQDKEEGSHVGLFEEEAQGAYPHITTVNGSFDFTVDTVDVDDMAYALASIRRYGGHADPRINVAQHSLTVAALAADPFEGLLHDAHEAYITDMPKPIKVQLPDYNMLEGVAASVVRKYFGLPEQLHPTTTYADMCTLFWEAYWIIHSKGEGWYKRDVYLQDWMSSHELVVLSDRIAEEEFKLAVLFMQTNTEPAARYWYVNHYIRPLLGIPEYVNIYQT